MDIFLKLISSFDLTWPILFLSVFLSAFIASFFYWREGRHELHESNFLLDLGFFSSFGGLIFSRIFAFFINFEYFNFDLSRFLFFHKFPGFSFWGFLIGALVFGSYFLKKRKEKNWEMFDLAVAPIVFGQFTFFVFKFLLSYYRNLKPDLLLIGEFTFFLFLFIWIKRLSAVKRSKGFFTSFYFVTYGLFAALIALVQLDFTVSTLSKIVLVTVPFAFSIFGVFLYFFLSKKKLINLIKGFFGLFLLLAFNIKRAITSIDEAGRISRNIIFLPYSLLKGILVLLRVLAKEARKAYSELLFTLGLKKF